MTLMKYRRQKRAECHFEGESYMSYFARNMQVSDGIPCSTMPYIICNEATISSLIIWLIKWWLRFISYLIRVLLLLLRAKTRRQFWILKATQWDKTIVYRFTCSDCNLTNNKRNNTASRSLSPFRYFPFCIVNRIARIHAIISICRLVKHRWELTLRWWSK